MKYGKLGILFLGAALCFSTVPYTALADTNNVVNNEQNQTGTNDSVQTKVELFHGIGLKSPTAVYASPSADSQELKSYSQGSVLIYETYNTDWFKCTVYINGKPTTGYIKASDVEVPDASPQNFRGIALKGTTKIYAKASRDSSELKSYDQGTTLYYHEFVSGWYECLVYINGKPTTGYINVEDVQVPESTTENIRGIALQGQTKIYSKASRNSNELKSYDQGTTLIYHKFVSGWYECLVYINGKPTTGYINADDVDVPVESLENVKGIALQWSTNIYSKASTSSKTLKSYDQGTTLIFHKFLSGWYECLVFINGKPVTGYINANDVEVPVASSQNIKGVALQNSTKIYTKASRGSKTLKSYDQGTVLIYHSFISGWYECMVYVNGRPTTGFINANDVDNVVANQENLRGPALESPTHIYAKPTTNSRILKSYARGTILQYKTFTSNWYECVVYVDGKLTTGYINAKSNRGIKNKIIVIDPGHGGIDPGATGVDGTYEKIINLAYAKTVKAELEKLGAKIIMTRDGDENCKPEAVGHDELQCRVDLSKKYNADLYVSIHANWLSQSSVTGAQTHFNDFNDPEYPGINDFPRESKLLAQVVQKEIVPALRERSDGVIDDNLYVTRENTVPAILIELGFISNRNELKNLEDSATRNRFAKALTVALAEYFKDVY